MLAIVLATLAKHVFNLELGLRNISKKITCFLYKDPIPENLNSSLVYKFTCPSCSSSYTGETCCYFKSRIEKHVKKDNTFCIFKHLHSTARCFDSCNSLSFKIIDKASFMFDLKMKEALHIN